MLGGDIVGGGRLEGVVERGILRAAGDTSGCIICIENCIYAMGNFLICVFQNPLFSKIHF